MVETSSNVNLALLRSVPEASAVSLPNISLPLFQIRSISGAFPWLIEPQRGESEEVVGMANEAG